MVSFDVSADAYARFMGRWSEPLAADFVARARVVHGQRALDVGCGPGALTARLMELLGAGSVVAIDPSAPFVDAIRARLPDVEAHQGAAERLPFTDDAFDVTLAQLVVHFMTDPVAGLTEMARVTRQGGRVASCVWDHAGGAGPLAVFWSAVRDIDPHAHDESGLAGAREGHLAELCAAAGLHEVESTTLSVTVHFPTFEDWWEPFTLGVGPAGTHLAALDEDQRSAVRDRCLRRLPTEPFDMTASAWCAVART